MRNTAPDFLKINPDGLTTLRMPVIPTIATICNMDKRAVFVAYYRGLDRYYNLIFAGRKISREVNFAGGKFREIPFAVDIIFAGGKFRAKSQFANIAKISSTRKIGVIQYWKLPCTFVLIDVSLNSRVR